MSTGLLPCSSHMTWHLTLMGGCVDTLKLLLEYDRLEETAIQRMWVKNFLFDAEKLSRAAVGDLLTGKSRVEPKRTRLFEDYQAAYYSFIAEREGSGYYEFEREVWDQLDGKYWQDNEINF